QYQVDGIVLVSATLSSALARECARIGVPVVLFNRVDAIGTVSAVSSDNVEGGRIAARALLGAGHRSPAFVAGLENTSTSRDREAGFREELARHGIRRYRRAVGHYSFDGDRKSTRLNSSHVKISYAVFCLKKKIYYQLIKDTKTLY